MRPIDADLFETVGLGDVSEEFAEGAKYILEKLDAAPTLEVVPVVHGQWKTTDTYFGKCCACSVCGARPTLEYRYCPYCGAKMDGGNEDGR